MTRINSRRLGVLTLAIGLALALVAPPPSVVRAAVVLVDIQGWNPDGSWSEQVLVPIAPSGEFGVWGWSGSTAIWDVENLDLFGNADPFLDFGFSFLNTSAFVDTFTVTITLPVTESWASASAGGSVGVTLTDANFSGGATLTSVTPDPVYLAKIDGSPLYALLDDPYTLSTAVLGGSTVGSDNFGLPGFTFPSGPIGSSMEVVLRFTLSPGDRAVITGTFAVVPEPGTAMVVVLGAVALGIGCRLPGRCDRRRGQSGR